MFRINNRVICIWLSCWIKCSLKLFILSWHCFPSHPGSHVHVKPFNSSWQVPCSQGSLAQSSISAKENKVFEREGEWKREREKERERERERERESATERESEWEWDRDEGENSYSQITIWLFFFYNSPEYFDDVSDNDELQKRHHFPFSAQQVFTRWPRRKRKKRSANGSIILT